MSPARSHGSGLHLLVADDREIRNVTRVTVTNLPDISFRLMFDPEHNLAERILQEQFTP